MEQNKKFIKVGDTVHFKCTTEGLDYDLEGGRVYTVKTDRWSDSVSFKTAPDLQMPEKVYKTDSDNKFINRVLNHYSKSECGTTGVMLSGLKGSGKTIMAKEIALESKLPIILIDSGTAPSRLITMFNNLGDTEVCVIMDEIDKLGEDYDDDYLLKILDGINTTGKKLVVCTCNDTADVSEYLFDRCSRIRYWREFEELSASMIQRVLEDKLEDKSEVKPLADFIIANFSCISFDNIVAFANEVNDNPTDTFEELFEDMNLSSK